MLQCQDLTVRYRELAAVAGLDLEVQSGSLTAVMGESGSGKTTLLRAIAGLVTPAAGSISWDGADITQVPPHLRSVGLMFQDYALFPHMSVGANVAFGLRMRGQGVSTIAARVDEMLRLVGLDDYETRAVAELSGGEQQRVALARTLAPQPALVLLDEPLGALDRARRDQLLADMQRIFHDVQVTALYVTHDHHEAFTIAEDVVVLDEGKKIAHGSPRQLWESPGHAVVATLLGFPILSEVSVSGGSAEIGRAAVPVALPDGHYDLAVPPDAVQLTAQGPVAATVRAHRFVDGTAHAVVVVDGVEIVAVADGDIAIGPGRLEINGERLRPVSR